MLEATIGLLKATVKPPWTAAGEVTVNVIDVAPLFPSFRVALVIASVLTVSSLVIVPVPMAVQRDEDQYPMQGPDALPAPFYEPPAERFLGLGGGSTIRQTRSQLQPTPTFVQVLTQLSQRWCRLAIARPVSTGPLTSA